MVKLVAIGKFCQQCIAASSNDIIIIIIVIVIIKLPDQAIASTPSAPRPPGNDIYIHRRGADGVDAMA
jgi:hypothetical protein